MGREGYQRIRVEGGIRVSELVLLKGLRAGIQNYGCGAVIGDSKF